MIYFDNSATTNPKPRWVIYNTNKAVAHNSFNSGRGGYKQSVDTAQLIYSVREKTAKLLNIHPENVVFTPNCTVSLNYAVKGSVSQGDHIIISNLEHNAVARPVYALASKGIITYDAAKFSFNKEETVNNFKRLIRPETKLIVCMHASNVFGCIFPIKEIGELARKNGIRLVVDAAQSAGVLNIDAEECNADIICAPGHKGLYGPMGSGFMATRDGILLDTIVEGGTGSSSMDLSQPDFMPDRFEAGTLNNSGIIGMGAGIDFVNSNGIDTIYEHELLLVKMLYRELEKIDNVTLYTPYPLKNSTAPILSFNFSDYSSEKTAAMLAEKGVAVRAGYHCSMPAHNAFSTADRGTVRISPSIFSTNRECEIFINYLKKL